MQSRKVKLLEIGYCWRPLKKNVFYTKEGYTCLLYMYGVSVLRYLVWILSLWDNISKMDLVMESITVMDSITIIVKRIHIILCTLLACTVLCTTYCEPVSLRLTISLVHRRLNASIASLKSAIKSWTQPFCIRVKAPGFYMLYISLLV